MPRRHGAWRREAKHRQQRLSQRWPRSARTACRSRQCPRASTWRVRRSTRTATDLDEVVAGIQRHAAAGMDIPNAWADELGRRIHEDRLFRSTRSCFGPGLAPMIGIDAPFVAACAIGVPAGATLRRSPRGGLPLEWISIGSASLPGAPRASQNASKLNPSSSSRSWRAQSTRIAGATPNMKLSGAMFIVSWAS